MFQTNHFNDYIRSVIFQNYSRIAINVKGIDKEELTDMISSCYRSAEINAPTILNNRMTVLGGDMLGPNGKKISVSEIAFHVQSQAMSSDCGLIFYDDDKYTMYFQRSGYSTLGLPETNCYNKILDFKDIYLWFTKCVCVPRNRLLSSIQILYYSRVAETRVAQAWNELLEQYYANEVERINIVGNRGMAKPQLKNCRFYDSFLPFKASHHLDLYETKLTPGEIIRDLNMDSIFLSMSNLFIEAGWVDDFMELRFRKLSVIERIINGDRIFRESISYSKRFNEFSPYIGSRTANIGAGKYDFGDSRIINYDKFPSASNVKSLTSLDGTYDLILLHQVLHHVDDIHELMVLINDHCVIGSKLSFVDHDADTFEQMTRIQIAHYIQTDVHSMDVNKFTSYRNFLLLFKFYGWEYVKTFHASDALTTFSSFHILLNFVGYNETDTIVMPIIDSDKTVTLKVESTEKIYLLREVDLKSLDVIEENRYNIDTGGIVWSVQALSNWENPRPIEVMETLDRFSITYPNLAIAKIWPPGELGIYFWLDYFVFELIIKGRSMQIQRINGKWIHVKSFSNKVMRINTTNVLYFFTVKIDRDGNMFEISEIESFKWPAVILNEKIFYVDIEYRENGKFVRSVRDNLIIKTRKSGAFYCDYCVDRMISVDNVRSFSLTEFETEYDYRHSKDVFLSGHFESLLLLYQKDNWKVSSKIESAKNTATSLVKVMSSKIRVIMGHERNVLNHMRWAAAKSLYDDARCMIAGRGHAIINVLYKGRRHEVYISVSGHLINMLLASTFGQCDFNRWLETVEANVVSHFGNKKPRKLRTKRERELIESVHELKRLDLLVEESAEYIFPLWHGFHDYWTGIAAYILLCLILHQRINVIAILKLRRLLYKLKAEYPEFEIGVSFTLFGWKEKIPDIAIPGLK